MGYTLSGFIGQSEPLRECSSELFGARIVSLHWRFSLLPLTEGLQEFWATQSGEQYASAFEAFYDLPAKALDWALATSVRTPLAYLEIDLHGGAGSRAAAVWSQKLAVLEPTSEKSPLATSEKNITNRALHLVGVHPDNKRDEFDVLGLGRYRHTSNWH